MGGGGIKYLILLVTFALLLAGCANAGKDQNVKSNTTVTLDASASTPDFFGKIKKYHWKQIKGKKVHLSNKSSIRPTFTAPTVQADTVLVFRLSTIEKGGYHSPWKTHDKVSITVKPSTSSNTPPTAKSEVNATTVKYGDSVTFDAHASTDSDGQISSYEWKDENNVVLSSEVQFNYTFATTGSHTITLTVTDDDGETSTDTVVVTVQELQKPTAVIHTSASSVTVGQSITFDANASSDADGQIVSYTWLDDTNTTLSNQKSFSHTFSTSGEHTITLVVMDNDALEGQDSVSVVAEALLVSVSLEPSSSSLEVNETTTLTATANYNDNTTQNVNASVVWLVEDPNILTVDADGTLTAHKSGTTTVQAKVGTIVSNTISIEVQEPVTLQSITVSPNPVNTRVGKSVQVNVAGHYSDGSTQNLEEVDYAVADTNIASVDGAGSIDGIEEGSTTLNIQAGAFISSVDVVVAKELNTTNFNFTNFGSTYTNQIPANATVDNYDEKRFCMIAGQIRSEDGSPLQGVKVSIYKHPEYGTTLTDSNGTYTIPSEGGLQLTMRYTKQGYTTIDRKIQAPVQDWVRSPDVTMLHIDSKVTQIDLANHTPQIHTSTPVVDDRGERATTLVFDGVTKATVTAPDGSTRELKNLSVRATEFKTPESMPSDLPNESAYTYCSDLSVDGVSDDEEVSFDAPVVMYVDNFLGFEVGEIVPVGYYDRKEGVWKASDNGVVVKLLDTDGDGKVDALDSNGSGTANDLNGDGSYEDEVAGIQNNPAYQAGKSYWRAEITHFTPWDHNWPYGPPEDSEDPEKPDPSTDDNPDNNCRADISSYVTTKSRVFHEDIPVAGTDITLHYSSKRVDGYKYNIESTVDTSTAPASTLFARATLRVGGKVFTEPLDLGSVNKLSFTWDGKDVLGHAISGEVTAKLTVSYVYHMVYYRSSRNFARAWAIAGSTATAVRGRTTLVRSSTKSIKVNTDTSSNENAKVANGWTLSNVHDMGTNAIYKGDGTKVEKLISLEDGLVAYYRFEGDAKDSSGQNKDGVIKGSLSYGDGVIGQAAIFDGTQSIKTPIELTGTEENQYLTISLWGKTDKNNNNNNNVFITNYNIGDGSNSVYLGAGSIGISGRFGGYHSDGFCYKYKTINISSIEDPVADACGNINTVDTIYDYGTSPVDSTQWHHYAFTYDNHYERIYIDGVKVIEKELEPNMIGGDNQIPNYPRGDSTYDRYLQIARDNNAFGYAESYFTNSMLKGAIDDLRIYKKVLTDSDIQAIYNQGKIGQSSYAFNGLNISDNNLEYQFDLDGKHLATKSYPSHKLLETYTYDANGYIETITDNFSQTTTITRDANGNPTSITAPNGQVTTLTVDEQGNLTEVKYEDDSKYAFSYFDGSLMDTMIDPNGNTIYHHFNDIGRIVEEVDGVNGSYRFLRDVTGGQTLYSTVLPEGETSTSKDVKLANGDIQSTMTLPTGETATATFAKDKSTTSMLRDGVSTKYTYTSDALTHQRILASKEVTQPSGLTNTTTYTTSYDGNKTHTNTKTQTITSNAKTVTDVTDYNNATETLTTPQGRVTKRTYDANTLLTSSTSTGTLTSTTYTYDNKGRVTTESTGDRTVTYTYDDRGNLATITDPRGQTTSYTYDIVDNLTDITYPNNTTEHFSYDKNKNLLQRTVPTPANHTFSYNGANLRVSNTSPLNLTTTYSYDKSKNITAITKPSGKTITNTYANGRLESTGTPEGTITYEYLFANKVKSITKGSEKFTFTYDGTLVTSIAQSGVLNHTTDFTYNNDFQVTSSTYAGATESYTYDNDGLLLTSGDYTLTRDAQNAYTTQVTDGTLTQTRSYNNFGEITEVSDDTFTYKLSQRDNAGAIVQKRETLNGVTDTYDYTFDEMGRLTKVNKDNQEVETYTYDNNGNRASATINGTTTTASYTLDDNLVVYGDNSYLYDDDGYLQTKTTPEGTTTYSYGTMGELLSVTAPTKTITYKHNANNQRVAKIVNGEVVEKYLWANLTTLLAIYDKDDNVVQRFEYADQRMPVAMTDVNGNKYYLHYDQVGSLRAVTDTSQNIIKEITYDTFGNVLTDSNPDFKVPFGFAGGLYDSDTKLTRFGYRDYDAYTGKWTAKDPIGFSGGDSNLYGYVLGDPVDWIDPFGLWFWDSNVSISKEEAESANNRNRGYGSIFDKPGKETGQKGIDIIDDRNYKHYKACTELMSAKRCKEMYPHKERKDKKEKSCQVK